MPELDKALEEHEKNPEKHPLYPTEWKKFWNRRYKELQAGTYLTTQHRFNATILKQNIFQQKIRIRTAMISNRNGLYFGLGV